MDENLISRRRLLGQTGLVIVAGALGSSCSPSSKELQNPVSDAPHTRGFDVREFGAVGDGKSDDTSAFQKALDERATNGGGIVHVPPGEYLIASHLTIPASVTLQGEWVAPPAAEAYHTNSSDQKSPPKLTGSILLAVENEGRADGAAFITLNTNSTLYGLTIFYPNQVRAKPPKAYPWTIQSSRGGADNCALVNVFLVNPYQAVDFGSRHCGRHYIRGLYGQPLRKGLWIDHCLDIGRVEDVHFWPFWTCGDTDSSVSDFMREEGVAFLIGRTDAQYMTNCFAIGYHIGMHFVNNPGTKNYEGAGNVYLVNTTLDVCDIAIQVDAVQSHLYNGVSFVNGHIYGDVIVAKSNGGPVKFTNCTFLGSISGKRGFVCAELNGRGSVNFSNCHFFIPLKNATADKIIHVKGERVAFHGCEFVNNNNLAAGLGICNPNHILLEPEVKSALVVCNQFWGRMRVINRSRGHVAIASNTDLTDDAPYVR